VARVTGPGVLEASSRPGTSVLIHGCDVVVTMDDDGTELEAGSILIEDGEIVWADRGDPPGGGGAQRVDGRGTIALPGLVNTHHHLYQVLTRLRATERGLFGWLTELYPVWAGVDVEWELAAARVGLAELALSGCTTTTDHHYVFPHGVRGLLEAEIGAARELGLRFHPVGRWTWASRRGACRPTPSSRTPTLSWQRPRKRS